jgi:hypothetical protein
MRWMVLLGVWLALEAGCDGDCEEVDQHAVDGWLVMQDIARTPGGLEDVPGRLAIAASGEMQLTFSRGAPSEIGEFGDPPTDHPHTPTRFRQHGGDWCGPLDTPGGLIAGGDGFYTVKSGDEGDLLLSRATGDGWTEPMSLEVPGMAADGVVGLAAGPDALVVAFAGSGGGLFVARIDGREVTEPELVFADSEYCLFHQLLVDADGHAHALATCDRTGSRIPTYASDASGSWQKEAIPYRTPAGGATIAVGHDGVVHSAGSSCLEGTCQSYDEPIVIAYTRRVGGVWSAPFEAIGRFNTEGISNPQSPQLAVLDDGLVVLAFIENHGGWWDDDTWLRFSRDGGPFGGSVMLAQTDGNHNVSLHQLAVNPATGLPVVLFRHYLPDNPSFSLGVAWPESAESLP